MPSTIVNGIRLHWWLTGESGEPLILVHGSWIDHRNWDHIIPALAHNFRVVAYDRRGHSRSERPPGPDSVSDDVSDLAALSHHLGFGPAHILGNSFGAVIALRLAASQPHLLQSLLVHEPPLTGLLDKRAREQFKGAEIPPPAVIELLEKGQMEAGARLFYETVVRAGSWDERPAEMRERWIFNASTFLGEERDPEARRVDLGALSHFRQPTLLTSGDQSPLMFCFMVEILARALPHAERRIIPGTGHGPHITHPTQYVDIVRSFIGKFASRK